MGRFAPLLPELILSIGGTILMMVAAFTGRRGSGATTWLAVALLLAATLALIGAPSHGGLSDNMPGYALLFMVFTMASVGLPGTSGFVGEFLSLVGTYRASSWGAVVATTGIILGAAYMLWLYWRICFGVQRNADAAAMPDLGAREWWLLAPIAAAVFWMGIYP